MIHLSITVTYWVPCNGTRPRGWGVDQERPGGALTFDGTDFKSLRSRALPNQRSMSCMAQRRESVPVAQGNPFVVLAAAVAATG
jgi:hypothetical protein